MGRWGALAVVWIELGTSLNRDLGAVKAGKVFSRRSRQKRMRETEVGSRYLASVGGAGPSPTTATRS